MSIIEELKRRNVFRVGLAYILMGWVLLQAADFALDLVDAPNWVIQVFFIAVIIGWPIALFFAWAFEMTPEGIKREEDVDRSQSIAPKTGRKLDYLIIGVLVLVIAFMAVERMFFAGGIQTSENKVAAENPQNQASVASTKSIAVLPFADLSQDQDQGWFADGLAEEILNALAKTPDLLVTSRTSAFKYKNTALDIPEIAAELGVANVLEGSVRSSGDRIRVTAQLIRASDGFHIWSENYDRDVDDMITIQEDLARNIANALETTMDPQALEAMTSAGTRSVEAYQLYLRGQDAWVGSFSSLNQEVESINQAYEFFEQARRVDPEFSIAHARAADYWKVQLTPSRTDSGGTDFNATQMLSFFNERIDLAVSSASSQIERIRFLAAKAELELRLVDAIALYQEYLASRPNDHTARQGFSSIALMASRKDLGLETLEYWQEKSLTDESAAIGWINRAYRLMGAEDAADFALQIADRWRTRGTYYQAHRTLLWAGRVLEAREMADRYLRLVPEPNPLLQMRQACAEGRREDAEKFLMEVDASDPRNASELWLMYNLLGMGREAVEVWRPFEENGVPYQLASQLFYNHFDPSPYPSVMRVLEREGVDRPPPVEAPFKCPPPTQPSIAVLPFVNMSADAENEFFSDGISEEILNVLGSIPDLKVAARTSAFAFKGSDAKIADIASELGVNHVLEGSVRKFGDQVRVTAQLIQADDGFHLWSESYDRQLDNIFAIQDEIAGAIADALKVSLELEAGTSGNLTGTRSIEAYEHYLQGMQLWYLRTALSLDEAIIQFEKAIELDPGFAKAYAGLSLAWGVYDGYVNTDGSIAQDKALEAAERALELDADSFEALAVFGLVPSLRHEFDLASDYFQRSLAINPSFATAHQWMASNLTAMGDPESGVAAFRQAKILDPRSRINGYNLAYRLDGLGQSDQAWAELEEVLSYAPEFPDANSLALSLSLVQGRCDEVASYAGKLVKMLNKSVDSTPVYLDLCQSVDPGLRSRAINTILGWDDISFASPDHPSLNYREDFSIIFMELGFEEAVWEVIERDKIKAIDSIFWFRTRVTERGLAFRCQDRYQQFEQESDIPPPVIPLNCPQ